MARPSVTVFSLSVSRMTTRVGRPGIVPSAYTGSIRPFATNPPVNARSHPSLEGDGVLARPRCALDDSSAAARASGAEPATSAPSATAMLHHDAKPPSAGLTTCTSCARTVALRRHRDGVATSVSTAFLPYNTLRVLDRRPLNHRCSFVVAMLALVVCAGPAAAVERPQIVASV